MKSKNIMHSYSNYEKNTILMFCKKVCLSICDSIGNYEVPLKGMKSASSWFPLSISGLLVRSFELV